MTSRAFVYASILSVAALPLPAGAQAPTYQGSLPAKVLGPRNVASSPEGDVYVTDVGGRLYRLTKRGQVVAKVLDGVVAVTAGRGVLFAGTKAGAVVQVDPRTGRVLRRLPLDTQEPAAALAYDEARGKVWVAFHSGMLQARGLDGTKLHHVPPASGAYRFSGMALDPAGTVWVAQDRTGSGGTLHAYDAETGQLKRSAPVDAKLIGGMASGAGGKVYVSDQFLGNVKLLGSDASPAGTVGTLGTNPGQLKEPTGVTTLPNGDVLVANMDGNRLDRFGSGAALPACEGDTDCDGLPDAWEVANGLDPNDPTDALGDRDGDGLNEAEEYALGTSARSKDTDGDGYTDAEEVASGFDPKDPNDHRPQVTVSGPSTTGPGYVRLSATVRDPVGDRGACTVQWRQTGGTPVALKGAATATPSFVARAAGPYRFEAVGTCGTAVSVATGFEVGVTNAAPRADGGRVVTVTAGGRVQLSAEWSADANGDALTYRWDQMVGPAVTGGVAGPTFAARLQTPAYYVFRVGATDGAGEEGASEVPVLALGEAGAPTAAATSPVRAKVGDAVELDASASYTGGAATFTWTQVSGPSVALEGAGERARFVAAEAGRYAFEVAVEEGGMRAPPARVDVYVASSGELPVARAMAPATAAVDVPVTLDGTGSSGSGGLTYEWRQVSGPAAGLTRADRAAATAVLFQPGSYEFELSVTDVAGTSVPTRVRVTARARGAAVPVAVASAAGTAYAGDLVALDGRSSTGAMRYRWTQVEGPWVAVEQGAVGTFVAKAPGVYGFELEVDDGAVRSAPARVNVVVFPNGTGN